MLALECRFDVCYQGFGGDVALVACHAFAVTPDEEFGKVPADVCSSVLRCSLFEEVVDGQGVCAVYVALAHEVKAHVIGASTKGGYLFGCARLLRAKLIARHGDHHQPLVLVSAVEGFKAFVLLGVATVAGRIDEEHHLTFVHLEWVWHTLVVGQRIAPQALGHRLHLPWLGVGDAKGAPLCRSGLGHLLEGLRLATERAEAEQGQQGVV